MHDLAVRVDVADDGDCRHDDGSPACQQRGHPVVDEAAHHQPRGGLLDPVDVQDLAGDAIQIVGVTGDDVHQQVGDPTESVHLKHFRDTFESVADGTQLALGDSHHDECGQRVAERRRIDPALKRLQNPAGLHPGQPCVNRVARQSRRVGQRHHGRPRIHDQCAQNPSVDVVDDPVRVRHSAHLTSSNAMHREHSAQPRAPNLHTLEASGGLDELSAQSNARVKQ
nr:hypothetical protein [Mycolicibacterium neoaurum]